MSAKAREAENVAAGASTGAGAGVCKRQAASKIANAKAT
jgi:hypothetical protein